jgi:hypothetical protein
VAIPVRRRHSAYKNNKTGYRNITYAHRNKAYRVQIFHNGKQIQNEGFLTLEEAIAARDETYAKYKIFRGFK